MKFLIVLTIVLSTIYSSSAQKTASKLKGMNGKSAADLLWDANPSDKRTYVGGISFPSKEMPSSEESVALKMANSQIIAVGEIEARRVWEWAILFKQMYPDDPRLVNWFVKYGRRMIPMFFKDPYYNSHRGNPHYERGVIDMEAYMRFEKVYLELENIYLSSSISDEEKVTYLRGSLMLDISRLRFQDNRGQEKLDLGYIKKRILELIPYEDLGNRNGKYSTVLAVLKFLIKDRESYKLDIENDLLPFFISLTDINNDVVRMFSQQQVELLRLIKSSFNIRAKDINGKLVDTKMMKEPLVYLDFWGTGCLSCIQSMPGLKILRDRYRSKGFEVISICINPEKDRDRILKIHNRVGADWPLLIIGGKGDSNIKGGLAKEIWDKYGFSSVPKLFLLDENRNVIRYMPSKVELEKILEERLGSK